MTLLIDTNVISEIRKGQRCNAGVAEWYAGVSEADLFISALVLGEIRKGIEIIRGREDFQQAEMLEAWLGTIVRRFSDRILPIDANVSDVWGRFYAVRNVPVIDGLMAATAIAHDFTFVTRNVSDVQGLGVRLLNPFSD